MSTRSVIAIATPSGWKGRYVHWDGYPSYRGPAIEDYVAEHGYAGYLDLLNTSPRGMSSFPERESNFAAERYEDGSEGWIIGCDETCSTCDPLFMEYVWIVRPNGTVQVRSSRRVAEDTENNYRHVVIYDGPLKGADWEAIGR